MISPASESAKSITPKSKPTTRKSCAMRRSSGPAPAFMNSFSAFTRSGRLDHTDACVSRDVPVLCCDHMAAKGLSADANHPVLAIETVARAKIDEIDDEEARRRTLDIGERVRAVEFQKARTAVRASRTNEDGPAMPLALDVGSEIASAALAKELGRVRHIDLGDVRQHLRQRRSRGPSHRHNRIYDAQPVFLNDRL